MASFNVSILFKTPPKIYVNYKDCTSHSSLVLPCILTEKGVIISHLRYLAWFNSKSEAWKERSCYALQLLLKYINSVPNIDSATKLLKAFTEALITGTINHSNSKDPLNLYWRPRSVRDTNNLLFHITHYTDFLMLQDNHSANRVNPFRKATSYEERLNWCAYYHKQANVFLNHLMCAEKTGGFNLVNYRHSSGVYHEQETEDLHRRI